MGIKSGGLSSGSAPFLSGGVALALNFGPACGHPPGKKAFLDDKKHQCSTLHMQLSARGTPDVVARAPLLTGAIHGVYGQLVVLGLGLGLNFFAGFRAKIIRLECNN